MKAKLVYLFWIALALGMAYLSSIYFGFIGPFFIGLLIGVIIMDADHKSKKPR